MSGAICPDPVESSPLASASPAISKEQSSTLAPPVTETLILIVSNEFSRVLMKFKGDVLLFCIESGEKRSR